MELGVRPCVEIIQLVLNLLFDQVDGLLVLLRSV